MIYPAQTSLIPVQIALARFVEQGGNIFGNYPYWYLGTTPFYYLTGPILPLILVSLKKIFFFWTLLEIFYLLIFISFLVGCFGLYFLVKELSGERRVAIMIVVFYAFGPILPFFFQYSGGLYLISFSFLPFILFLCSKFLRKWNWKLATALILLISFAILVDSLILPTLFLGMVAIFLAQVGWKKPEEKGLRGKRQYNLPGSRLVPSRRLLF